MVATFGEYRFGDIVPFYFLLFVILLHCFWAIPISIYNQKSSFAKI